MRIKLALFGSSSLLGCPSRIQARAHPHPIGLHDVLPNDAFARSSPSSAQGTTMDHSASALDGRLARASHHHRVHTRTPRLAFLSWTQLQYIGLHDHHQLRCLRLQHQHRLSSTAPPSSVRTTIRCAPAPTPPQLNGTFGPYDQQPLRIIRLQHQLNTIIGSYNHHPLALPRQRPCVPHHRVATCINTRGNGVGVALRNCNRVDDVTAPHQQHCREYTSPASPVCTTTTR